MQLWVMEIKFKEQSVSKILLTLIEHSLEIGLYSLFTVSQDMEGVSNSYRIQDSGYRMQNTGYRIQLQDMQKDNLFTQTWFEPNMFYPKKGVNYNKSNP